ncbi:hypothetical protein DFH07DRAFT_741148 [Mycena maculata]|uniref:DUF7918 domain-containing protein n=1 Tax=Mycena maculata TaxID=230809 RepID=A0AAD7J8B9_9AGAR|nr:hypothetical protein DFH07DRAFT_741148 [Mycena maculata]
MQLGQFSASVSVDGAELSEYAVEYSADGKEATCWIPSENDKASCSHNQASVFRQISGVLTVDGIHCEGKTMKIRRTNPTFSKAARDSVATSATKRRPLLFSKQALTDDDEYLNTAISPHLGTIRVKIRHVRRDTRGPTIQAAKNYQTQILHERSKKAIGHSVKFGAEYEARLNRKINTHLVQELVTFVFKYRPIELLRAQGIAPPAAREERAVSPTNVLDLTMDVDEDDDAAEIRKLQERLETLQNKNKRVKREPSNAVKKEVKREEPIFKPGEVIDLT